MKRNNKNHSQPLPGEIRMGLSVYEKIRATIGAHRAESGGMLGGDITTGTVTHFFYDESAGRSAATYSPDTKTVNRVLKENWNPAGVRLIGFPHSHPPGFFQPSGGDGNYATVILAHNPEMPFLAVPIVQTVPDIGEFKMRMFLAQRDGADGVRFVRVKLVLFEDGDEASDVSTTAKKAEREANETALARKTADDNQAPTAKHGQRTYPHLYAAHQPLIQSTNALCAPDGIAIAPPTTDLAETFRRVQAAYDLQRMARSRLIYVAVGGAAGFAEDMARAGLGEHVIIEPDVVSQSNLATQQTYCRDIGRPKAECVADRILDINPSTKVVTRQQFLDEIDDDEFRHLALDAFPGRPAPEVVVLCGFTDAFPPQARVNRLGLKLGLPTLCAQVYREGRAAELTFTVPGLTPACHRCILSARYKAYLQDGYRNDVTSDGTPIFATTRLNATKGFIVMAILHHGTSHPRWGSLLQRIGNRNLVQIRLDPDVESTIGIRNFSEALRGADAKQTLFDESIWRPQLQECPATGYVVPCPECGGTGDLRDAIGKFADTRIMPA
jgi:proteasome lid subunit RPN8/RPN11